jgi:hypothetical protein
MDDFVLSNLNESRNEWCSRLVGVLCPMIMEGIRSIFNESWKLSSDNSEIDKYLMTFQNLLCRVPKWNATIIDDERKRIIEKSGCNYLEDLITCVHVIQLKVLTCVRVGARQKKIDISIPKLSDFIHKAYINVASKVYRNAYLFDKHATPLQQQKYNREFEVIVEECLLKTIRDSIPTEAIVRAYLDESVEQEEEIIIENAPLTSESEGGEGEPVLVTGASDSEVATEKPIPKKEDAIDYSKMPEMVPAISNISDEPIVNRLTFDDVDHAVDVEGRVEKIEAPKSIERLEEISVSRNLQRKLEEEANDSDDERLIISDDVNIDLGAMSFDPIPPVEEEIKLDFDTL